MLLFKGGDYGKKIFFLAKKMLYKIAVVLFVSVMVSICIRHV